MYGLIIIFCLVLCLYLKIIDLIGAFPPGSNGFIKKIYNNSRQSLI